MGSCVGSVLLWSEDISRIQEWWAQSQDYQVEYGLTALTGEGRNVQASSAVTAS